MMAWSRFLRSLGGFGRWREGAAEIVEQVVVGLGGEGVGERVGVDGGGGEGGVGHGVGCRVSFTNLKVAGHS